MAFRSAAVYHPVMPRTARASLGNWCYHVLNRGNARTEVFHQAEDFEAFVGRFEPACERLPMRGILARRAVPLPSNWIQRVHEPLTEAELAAVRSSVNRGTPFGGERWTRTAAAKLGLEFTLRPPGRPRKSAKK